MTKTRTRTNAISQTPVRTTTQARAKDMRKHLTILSKTIDTSYVGLAKGLREAYKKEYYKDWGFDSIYDYALAELDIELRKCQTLIQIADKMDELKISEKKAAAIGWSKMREIIKVATKKNLDKWMNEAKKVSLRDLSAAVKVVRTQDPHAKIPNITSITFTKLGEGAASIVLEALEEAKAVCGSEDSNVAIEMICQDWMEMKGTTPTQVSLKDRIKFIEKNYDVKLTVGGAGGGCEKEPKVTKKTVAKKTTTKKTKGKGSPIKAKTKGKKTQVIKGKAAAKDDPDDLFRDDSNPSQSAEQPPEDLNGMFGM